MRIKEPHLFAFLSFVYLWILYFPILGNYAFTDALQFYWDARQGREDYANVFIEGGRPFYALLNQFFFGNVPNLNSLWIIRASSLIISWITALQFYHICTKLSFSKTIKWLSILCFLTLPCYTVYIGWTVTHEVPYSISMALIAANFILFSFDKSQSRKISSISLGLFFLILSLLIYQPGTTVFVVVILMKLFQEKTSFKTTFYSIGLYLLSFGLYYLVFKALLSYLELDALGRSGIQTDVLGKLEWFINQPYKIALKLNFISHGKLIQTVITTLVYLSILGYFFHQIRYRAERKFTFLKLFLFLILLPLSHLPNIVSIDNWVCARSMPGISLFIAFAFIYTLNYWLTILNNKKLSSCFLFLFMGSITGNTIYNLKHSFVDLQEKDLIVFRQMVDEILSNGHKEVIIIQPSFSSALDIGDVNSYHYDEFGIYSNSQKWTTPFMLNQVVFEKTGKIELVKSPNSKTMSNQIIPHFFQRGEKYKLPIGIPVYNLHERLKDYKK